MAQPRVLLVEGKDDQHVLWALLVAHGLPDVFSVVRPRDENSPHIDDSGGIQRLLDSIPVWLKSTGLERIGIVLDADADLANRWQQVKDRLHSAQIGDVPDGPAASGTIIDCEGGLRLGVWLMPDNQLPGILEHFLAFLIPDGDRGIAHVDRFLASIPDEDRSFPEIREAKARLHAWLSIQNEPGKPLGQSITARYLDAAADVAAPFISWIRAVMVD